LPANAVCQPTSMPQTHRHRGQARSCIGCALAAISRQDTGIAADSISKPYTKPVGAGLLANAVCQPKFMAQTHRHRGQARSYIGCAAADLSRQDTDFAADAISKPYTKPVGAGLLANAVCQPTSMPRTHRHRGQAGSYTGFAAADLSRQDTGCAPGDIYSLTLPLPGLSAVQEGFSAGWVCSTPYPTRRLAPEDLLMLTFNKLFLALAFLGLRQEHRTLRPHQRPAPQPCDECPGWQLESGIQPTACGQCLRRGLRKLYGPRQRRPTATLRPYRLHCANAPVESDQIIDRQPRRNGQRPSTATLAEFE
jgi:hypothetical protein